MSLKFNEEYLLALAIHRLSPDQIRDKEEREYGSSSGTKKKMKMMIVGGDGDFGGWRNGEECCWKSKTKTKTRGEERGGEQERQNQGSSV